MKRAPSFRPRGSVLVVVLWASVGLVSIALLFGHSMLMTYRGADNDLAGRQADMAIDGAVRYARSLVFDPDTRGTFPDPKAYEAEALTVGEATLWLLGRANDDANISTQTYGLVDEASKLNLNNAPLKMLQALEIKGMTTELANAIDVQRSSGTATGGGSTTPVKGLAFESVEELARLPEATPQILYGEDTNQNGFVDSNENDGERSPPADNTDGRLDDGILNYLTVFTREPRLQSDGTTPRVDVTTLATDAAPALVPLIAAYADREAELRQNIRPGAFQSVIDFFLKSGVSSVLSDEEFDKVALNFMTPDGSTPPKPITGVNVNTASATVLACIVGQEIADELVAERVSRGGYTTGIAWAAHLLASKNLTTELAYLTGQSYQVSADVAAVGRHGRGYRRTRFVIDTNPETNPNSANATEEPRIIYRRNLASLGWALGPEVRQQLALKKEVR
jgi:type II secretory pathway component PulK